MSLIYQGDEGVKIVAQTNNLTFPTPTTFTLLVKKPTGATAEWSLTADYTTGEMVHTTVHGDLNEIGEYEVQVKAVFDTGDEQVSNRNSFSVFERIY